MNNKSLTPYSQPIKCSWGRVSATNNLAAAIQKNNNTLITAVKNKFF